MEREISDQIIGEMYDGTHPNQCNNSYLIYENDNIKLGILALSCTELICTLNYYLINKIN